MPPPQDEEHLPEKPLHQIVEELGCYPLDAFQFVQEGLSYTVQKTHGERKDPSANRHVSGQQLCEGLREYALLKWGLMARTVLARWNITCTFDFGKIVFALVENGHMQKTEQDCVDDFRDAFDFQHGFEAGYKIEHAP